jgi:uncharacterized protein (TIGR02246 family)
MPTSRRTERRTKPTVKRLATQWQEAWNKHDMDALASLVAEDVGFVTVSGAWLRDRKAFKEHHAQMHVMQFKESVWSTTEVEVKSVKPQIAIVHLRWGMKGDKDPDGTPRPPRRGVFTWAVTRPRGSWLIQAAQITNLAEPGGRARDEGAVKQLALRWQEAWNRHDMDALASLVAEDIDFVAVGAAWMKGRKAFKEVQTRTHSMQFKESVWTPTAVEVKFLEPDTALVHVNWSLKGDKDADGTPRPSRRGIHTWVVTRQPGGWIIQAGQNTNVREPS